jgi:hypothetical protein
MPQIDIAGFPEPGLYLIWPDGSRLDLTRAGIEAHTRAMLDDPTRIPAHVKAAAEYKACEICPKRDTAEICHSIMTALPFMDSIDHYMSYDKVVAVFRGQGSEVLQVVETTMTEALKYVTILGLTQYCEVGKKYEPYFEGIDPLMPPPDIAALGYRNLFCDLRGDMGKIRDTIRTMQDEILQTTRCQMARLELISHRDAFLNAFVATYTITQYVFMELEKRLHQDLGRASLPVEPAGTTSPGSGPGT